MEEWGVQLYAMSGVAGAGLTFRISSQIMSSNIFQINNIHQLNSKGNSALADGVLTRLLTIAGSSPVKLNKTKKIILRVFTLL